jgi:hypothetical protein
LVNAQREAALQAPVGKESSSSRPAEAEAVAEAKVEPSPKNTAAKEEFIASTKRKRDFEPDESMSVTRRSGFTPKEPKSLIAKGYSGLLETSFSGPSVTAGENWEQEDLDKIEDDEEPRAHKAWDEKGKKKEVDSDQPLLEGLGPTEKDRERMKEGCTPCNNS